MSEGLSRRRFVLAGGLVLLSGCSGGGTPTTSRPAASASRSGSSLGAAPTPAPTATPATGSGLPAVTRWRPSRGDVSPGAKRAAVRYVQRRGNAGRRALQVIDAQYGGILADSASVLVVTRSWRATAAGPDSGGATYDVRLSRTNAGWRVTAVHPSQPGRPARGHSAAAAAVLASPRIDLPPAACADVLSGQVHDTVLVAMHRLSESFRIGVSVVRSGHPRYVFGTDRLSDHPQGRAFDTWRIDGRMVVDPDTPRRLVVRYMEAAAGVGSYNVGGPYLLGAAPQYFSDATHHDHVHAGFAT